MKALTPRPPLPAPARPNRERGSESFQGELAEGRGLPGTAGVSPASSGFTADLGDVLVHFGAGVLSRLGEAARELGGTRALVVTDPGVRAAGWVDRALAALGEAGLDAAVFDRVDENPTTAHVEDGREAAAAFGVDLLVGLGGGSAMDCAKGINFLLTNGGSMEDYWGTGRARLPMLPSIGVPTTAGTGSEAQSYAVISQEGTHRKMACGDRKARFRTVLLDPDLVASAPRRVAAAAGIDAVAHAVESAVTTRANPVSRMLSREAWRLLQGLPASVLGGPGGAGDAAARADALLGAHLAGAAIEASMLGAAHACANPLTAHHGIAHGVAVALMLPHVVRFNATAAEAGYRALVGDGGAELVARRVEELRATLGLPARLSEVGVRSTDLARLAEDAAAQWTAGFNPRPVTADDLLGLYGEAL